MFGAITKAAVVLGLVGAASCMTVRESFAGQDAVVFAAVGSETTVPYGWDDFCQRYRGECENDARAARDVDLTDAVFKKIAAHQRLCEQERRGGRPTRIIGASSISGTIPRMARAIARISPCSSAIC